MFNFPNKYIYVIQFKIQTIFQQIVESVVIVILWWLFRNSGRKFAIDLYQRHSQLVRHSWYPLLSGKCGCLGHSQG